jgi:tetratricopeptide (TPR) repeat protein
MSDGPRKLVPFDRTPRRPDPARVAEFAATARRLQQERDASDVVAQALKETPRGDWPQLVERQELRTSGVLERLAKIADSLERDPQEALAVARLATSIADAIEDDTYPRVVTAQLRAHAWKDLGRALCYLARYEDSLDALDRADSYMASFGTLAHDRAIVHFVRSIVLQHLRRFDEARALLAECRTVFLDHGDTRLYGKCTLAFANLLVRRGDHAAARDLLMQFLPAADRDAAAIASSTLGWCALHLGSPDEALDHFTSAMQRFRQLEWELECVRASYGAGCALLRLGRPNEAIERLRPARERFIARALVEEAGLSGLEIVEAHMIREDIEEAKALAAMLVQEFTAANLNRRAVAALAYLNDAMTASSATPEIVRSVHAYISALRIDPTQEFSAATN